MGRLLRFKGVVCGGVMLALMLVASSCSDEPGGQTGENARPAPEEVTREVTKVVTVAEAPKQDKPTTPKPVREQERRPAAAPTPPEPELVDDAPSDEQYEPGTGAVEDPSVSEEPTSDQYNSGSPSEAATDFGAPDAEGGTDATFVVGETASADTRNEITVYSYEYVSPTDVWQPEPGFEYNAADVEACASPNLEGSTDFNPYYFGLQMPDNTRLQTDVGVKEPALNLTTLVPGDCVRGYVTFQVPQGEAPAYIIFSAGSSIIKWAVQGVEREATQYEPEPDPEAEVPLPEATNDESPRLAPSEEVPPTESTTEPVPQYETTPTPTGEPSGGGEVLEDTTTPEQY